MALSMSSSSNTFACLARSCSSLSSSAALQARTASLTICWCSVIFSFLSSLSSLALATCLTFTALSLALCLALCTLSSVFRAARLTVVWARLKSWVSLLTAGFTLLWSIFGGCFNSATLCLIHLSASLTWWPSSFWARVLSATLSIWDTLAPSPVTHRILLSPSLSGSVTVETVFRLELTIAVPCSLAIVDNPAVLAFFFLFTLLFPSLFFTSKFLENLISTLIHPPLPPYACTLSAPSQECEREGRR